MNKVVSIGSRTLKVPELYPQATNALPEEAEFWTGVALTMWVPVLMACYVTGLALPFYVMICTESLGFVLGVWRYRHPVEGPLSCVPKQNIPRAPGDSGIQRMIDAA
jgi:hypothetical protein